MGIDKYGVDEEASRMADEMLAEAWSVLDAPTSIFNTTDEELDYLYEQQKAHDKISMEEARRDRDWVRE